MCNKFEPIKQFMIYFFLFIIIWPISSRANNDLQELKIAVIFKKKNSSPFTSSRYINFYKQGLETASYLGKKNGISIKYKFYTMANIEHIPEQMQEIKNWNPDFIIGPNYSNAFLLLKNYFKDILVLSAYANDQSIATMSANFHTLNPLSGEYAQALSNYIAKEYPQANVFGIVDASCKSCFTLSKVLVTTFKTMCPKSKISLHYIDDFNLNKTSVNSLVPGYSKKDVILMLTTSDFAVTLIPKIATHVGHSVTFIGADTWGSSVDTELDRLKTKIPYKAIHIIPWSLQLDTPELKFFKKTYSQAFKRQPVDDITFAVFSTVNSVFYSLKKCSGNEKNLQTKILNCYKQQLKLDPKAFRPKQFAVEQFNTPNSTLLGSIPSNEKYYCQK